jgi:hypothetical protein
MHHKQEKWTNDCENAFKTLKQALITAPVLGYPNFNKPFILACDASGSAIGYILSQLGDDNKEHVIKFLALRIHIYWVLRSNLPFLIFEKLNLNVVNEIQNLLTR